MGKEKVDFKRISKGQGKICNFCEKETAIWYVSYNGSASRCCGSKHCRKKAEKFVLK